MSKICKECKSYVSNAKWVSKYKLCKNCNAKRYYADKHPEHAKRLEEYNSMTKDELINILMHQRINNTDVSLLLAEKRRQILRFRVRILKIRNELDYLLNHPYSQDNSFKTRPHKRDKGVFTQAKSTDFVS